MIRRQHDLQKLIENAKGLSPDPIPADLEPRHGGTSRMRGGLQNPYWREHRPCLAGLTLRDCGSIAHAVAWMEHHAVSSSET